MSVNFLTYPSSRRSLPGVPTALPFISVPPRHRSAAPNPNGTGAGTRESGEQVAKDMIAWRSVAFQRSALADLLGEDAGQCVISVSADLDPRLDAQTVDRPRTLSCSRCARGRRRNSSHINIYGHGPLSTPQRPLSLRGGNRSSCPLRDFPGRAKKRRALAHLSLASPIPQITNDIVRNPAAVSELSWPLRSLDN
jgi:hypothetical protein